MTLDLDHLRRVAEAADSDDFVPVAVIRSHVATFDPPTVLALIDRLEAAEAKVDEAQRAALTWKRRAEDAEEAMGRVVALADDWMAQGDLTASEGDGGPEGHWDDDNAGDGRCGAQEGKR